MTIIKLLLYLFNFFLTIKIFMSMFELTVCKIDFNTIVLAIIKFNIIEFNIIVYKYNTRSHETHVGLSLKK